MNLTPRIFLFLAMFLMSIKNTYSQKIIKLEKINGVYKIPCKVNGIPMNFIFDTGASEVSISLTEAMFLVKQGLLTDNDIKEDVKYKLANGKIEEGTKIMLKQIEIKGLILENIEASVVHNLDAPLLLGLNAISKLGKVVLEDNKLIIYPKNIQREEVSTSLPIDSVFYSDVQQAFLILFQTLKTKDSKTFIEKCRHLFVTPDTLFSEEDLLKNQFKNTSSNNNSNNQALDNMIREDYNRLFSFGIKHSLNWSNVKPSDIKFSVDKSDIIITFRHVNDFYVMKSWFYLTSSNSKNVIDFPTEFESIKAYQYNKTIKGFFDEYDNKKISEKEYRDKQVEYSEWQYKYLSKNDIQYLHWFNKIEDAYELRALFRFQNEADYLGAIQDWNRVIELSTGKQLAGAYYSRGRCKLALEDFRGAILDFDKYILLDSKVSYKSVYSLRADSKYSLKNYKGALEDYNKAIMADQKDYIAYYNRGLVKYFYLNDKEGGCSDWSKAGELGLGKAYELINEHCH